MATRRPRRQGGLSARRDSLLLRLAELDKDPEGKVGVEALKLLKAIVEDRTETFEEEGILREVAQAMLARNWRTKKS